MKVAVSSKGTERTSVVDPRFGRAPYFVIVDTESDEVEGIENPGALAGTGAGVAAAQLIADAGAEAVITSALGPHAWAALKSGGIQVFEAGRGTVDAMVQLLLQGGLTPIEEPNADLKAGAARFGQSPDAK